MDVVRALGAELRKMFAGDLLLTLGTLATVLGLAVLQHARMAPATGAPYLLATAVVGVFVAAVAMSAAREIKRKSDK